MKNAKKRKDFANIIALSINDCQDPNAALRAALRLSVTLPGVQQLPLAGVSNDIELALNLVDALDAIIAPFWSGRPTVEGITHLLLGNVAWRVGAGNHGTQFAYCLIRNTLVITTMGGYEFSLLKKVGLDEGVIQLLNVETVTHWAEEQGLIDAQHKHHIDSTQYRSYELSPLLARWILQGLAVPSTEVAWEDIPELTEVMPGYIDYFGNAKLTVLDGQPFATLGISLNGSGFLKSYPMLSEVPDGHTALTKGSSGFYVNRFTELVIKGGSAGQKYGLKTGQVLP